MTKHELQHGLSLTLLSQQQRASRQLLQHKPWCSSTHSSSSSSSQCGESSVDSKQPIMALMRQLQQHGCSRMQRCNSSGGSRHRCHSSRKHSRVHSTVFWLRAVAPPPQPRRGNPSPGRRRPSSGMAAMSLMTGMLQVQLRCLLSSLAVCLQCTHAGQVPKPAGMVTRGTLPGCLRRWGACSRGSRRCGWRRCPGGGRGAAGPSSCHGGAPLQAGARRRQLGRR